ncbi:cadherin-17 [Acipenser oxyrinchus oxyrinchus]|uniref:Cadherin-17 n=1 Tax=Acipenser oxyrinchus oxyrinchus TaxID=40147 RepID=A0AAD8GDR4_ACIOX|nr:cadherin-17 [Acipenser oxyrinchus oxyrinchus]
MEPIGLKTKGPLLDRVLEVPEETDVPHGVYWVEALDADLKTVEGPVSITIIVKDMNDNRPDFNQTLYDGVVRQHSRPGRPFMRVYATDKDDPSTPNAKHFKPIP